MRSVPTDKGANAGLKVASLVGGMIAGADSIDASPQAVLGPPALRREPTSPQADPLRDEADLQVEEDGELGVTRGRFLLWRLSALRVAMAADRSHWHHPLDVPGRQG